ncbi:MAG: DUF4149 domain-containing protein [Pseudomonas sp.]|uniref:DUF4149 domain-containing protein n=1 Tax=Pseudomonas sp. TaxID=306 RepID=UPI0033995FA1
MSKSVISSRPTFTVACWQLAQTCWVGGLALLHFAVLPALGKIGLASLLVEDLSAHLKPLMVLGAVAGVLVQALLLVQVTGLSALWRDRRGQALLAALAIAAAYFGVHRWAPDAAWWLQFGYLLLLFCGLLLVVQPAPQRDGSQERLARH